MCSHIWATLIWCIVCVSLKKNWSPSWRSKPRFQSITDSRPPVPPSPGSNRLALLAVYRWVSDLCDLGHYGALGFSTWVETMSCLTKLASKCPPKKPFWCLLVQVVGMSVCHSPVFFWISNIDSIFLGGGASTRNLTHVSPEPSAVMCFTNSPWKCRWMQVLYPPSVPWTVWLDLGLRVLFWMLILIQLKLPFWGMFRNGVGSQKRLMFK